MEHANCLTHNKYNNNKFDIFILEHNSIISREVTEKNTTIGYSAVKLYLPVVRWLFKYFAKIHITF